MRFHWYWPFAREEELAWATATPRQGESILVEVIDREVAPSAGAVGPVTVVRDLPDVERSAGPLTWLPSRARTYLRRDAARRQHWSAERFDLIHLHYLNRFTDWAVRVPAPLVMSVHDVLPHVSRLGALEERLLRTTYARAGALVVHHEELRHRLITRFAIDPGRVHVVPHQVFATSGVASAPGTERPTILFFGALRANKGLAGLLEAFRRIPTAEVDLVIAGRGDADQEALVGAAAARDPRITAEIGFVPLERKRQLFRAASLVVLPYSSFESQSGVLHDAYGHGCPVVVTDVGALGTTVREDGTGIVVPPGDSDALAAAMLDGVRPGPWETFAAATVAIRASRSPERTGQRLRAVYDDVLQS